TCITANDRSELVQKDKKPLLPRLFAQWVTQVKKRSFPLQRGTITPLLYDFISDNWIFRNDVAFGYTGRTPSTVLYVKANFLAAVRDERERETSHSHSLTHTRLECLCGHA